VARVAEERQERGASSAAPALPPGLDRRFEAIVFDWDGTAVPDRAADAGELRRTVEALCSAGVDLFVVTGTHVGNVDGQLRARPAGPGRLYLCLNRGSEVFRVDPRGPLVVERREATAAEDAALTRAADLTVEKLAQRGLRAEIVSQRLNRRKIDLIPEPEWADPPKARIGELLVAVEARLCGSGLAGGLAEAIALTERIAREHGLPDARITTDVKHIEVGLTDKGDSVAWLREHLLAPEGIAAADVLVVGDERAAPWAAAAAPLPATDERVAPVLQILPLQQMAHAMAVARGYDPDAPRGLKKVTETR
jgi:hypothetical protein